MVSFHDNPDRYDTSLTITQLEEQINKSTTVSERVIKTDRIVGCSKEYLQKVRIYIIIFVTMNILNNI